MHGFVRGQQADVYAYPHICTFSHLHINKLGYLRLKFIFVKIF